MRCYWNLRIVRRNIKCTEGMEILFILYLFMLTLLLFCSTLFIVLMVLFIHHGKKKEFHY